MGVVYPGLYVGGEEECADRARWAAVVHACKFPCHAGAVGYERSIAPDHPEYLVAQRGPDLYLNMIDPPTPMFRLELFQAALDFLSDAYHASRDGALLIHCNLGQSRAPSIALCYLAKRRRALPGWSYNEAAADFGRLYPAYAPGRGIRQYLTEHWDEIR